MNWPHGPAHWLFEPGLYIVTAGTYQKLPHLSSPLRLDFFLDSLFRCAPIRLELARLVGVAQSLSLRCRVTVRLWQSAEISRQASHANGQTT
jgi:hypothetical protein